MNLSIGENIRIMRRRCGFTQEELAARLSVTPQAVSKWENGGGFPDLMQIVPLAQIFGITTDSLLGVTGAVYGKAHTEAAMGHEKLLMESSLSAAEKHLTAYSYFRAESEKEPSNYAIMCRCINHAAEISRYVDFEDFMADRIEERDEIFEDCKRKNACITRFCEDRAIVEKSDFAMAWIYIHTKEYDKASALIDRLPSLESNNLRESIMTKLLKFQYGFDRAKENISENIRKLLHATAKEFFYDFEDYAWDAESGEAIAFGQKLLGILQSYNVFEELHADVLLCENHIRSFFPKCYADMGDYETAAEELLNVAQNFTVLSSCAKNDWTNTPAMLDTALSYLTQEQREEIQKHSAYREAIAIMERVEKNDPKI